MAKSKKKGKGQIKDYGVLFKKLWRIPTTKLVLGGAAVTAMIPFTLRFVRSHPEISDFVRENINEMEEKMEEVSEKITEKVSKLKAGGKRGDLSEMSH